MSSAYPNLQVNPFEDDVVREPREVSFSVKGLNDVPLNALLNKFSRLDSGAQPHGPPVKADKAQLVVSPDRGYGKSHLLGRLFAKLGNRATKVYLRPFQDPNKAWHSILLLTIQEMDRPDDENDSLLSQLEALAVGTLAYLDSAGGSIPGQADVPSANSLPSNVNNAPPDAEARRWTKWLLKLFADSANRPLSGPMSRRHINLVGREKAWLKILSACVPAQRDTEQRGAALKWLRAEPLEPEEIALLRLDAADNEGRGDSSAQEINELSFRRLRGLCQLASYYRPFVFCFDQTEFYGSDQALIKTLGKCIEQLFVDLPNHLTVVTANQANWVDDILPHMEPPHRERLSAEIRLEGIRIEGARELITERLKGCDIGADDIAIFFADGWLEQVFTPMPELGVRALLMRATERFRLLAHKPPDPKPELDDLFQAEVNSVRSKKALMAYNQDCLMWFVKDVGQALTGVSAGKTVNRRYFSLEWTWPDRRVCFAFEGGDHWKRWQSIADEGLKMARARGAQALLTYVFRTPDLTRVPKPTWAAATSTLDEAKTCGFHICELTLDRVCELHAARELYSDALQGNIVYSEAETLAFLQTRFAPFLTEIAFRQLAPEANDRNGGIMPPIALPKEKPPARPIELDAEKLDLVLETVRKQKIIDISAVLGKLGSDDLRDPLLRSVEAHPNLKAHPGPKTTFLQWRITR
jgi:hypothetical protein